MGMYVRLRAASSAKLEQLKSDPSIVNDFIDSPVTPPGNDVVDIDKAWHAIHYMLTGTMGGGDDPLSSAIWGGEEIGDDFGYGPARLLPPPHVEKVAKALSAIDEAAFRAKYDPQQMEADGVYPQIWLRDGKEALDYVVVHYLKLVNFYREAAKRGDGVIILLS